MGLSATQMRFLMVTARKSNVEFQGQQINQARTGLANQSSALYTELMELKAPTAPSVYQYVINPTTAPTIDWTEVDPMASVDMDNFMVHYAGNQPTFQDFNIPEYKTTQRQNEDGTIETGWHKYMGKDEKGDPIYGDFVSEEAFEIKTQYEKCESEDEETGETVISWKLRTGTDEQGNPVYDEEKTLTDEQYQEKTAGIDDTFCYKETGKDANGNAVDYTAIKVSENANYTYNIETGLFTPKDGYETTDMPQWLQMYNTAMGQYTIYSQPKKTAIYSANQDLSGLKTTETVDDPNPVAYSNSATVSYNQAQYNAAYEQYKQDLEEYEKAYDQINSKIEEIHTTDEKLELQLKQLDTEQEAIQTEYDALKKVLDKNIENTFKTFG